MTLQGRRDIRSVIVYAKSRDLGVAKRPDVHEIELVIGVIRAHMPPLVAKSNNRIPFGEVAQYFKPLCN